MIEIIFFEILDNVLPRRPVNGGSRLYVTVTGVLGTLSCRELKFVVSDSENEIVY